METARNPRKVCSRIGFALAALAVGFYGGAYLMSWRLISVSPMVRDLFTTSAGMWLVNDLGLYAIGLPAFLLIIWKLPEAPQTERKHMKMTVGKFLLLLVFCLGSAYIISFVVSFLTGIVEMYKPYDPDATSLSEMIGASGTLLNLFFVAVVPAIGEEFIFRYMLQKKLRGAGDKVYILISGLSFGLFHMNVNQLFFTFVFGMTLAWIYAITGKMWIPVSLHFINNFISSVVLPKVLESETATVITGLLIFVVMGGAIAIFCASLKRVRKTFMPPTEGGWPYKAPKRKSPYLAAEPANGYPVYRGQPAMVTAGGYPSLAPYLAPPMGAAPQPQMAAPDAVQSAPPQQNEAVQSEMPKTESLPEDAAKNEMMPLVAEPPPATAPAPAMAPKPATPPAAVAAPKADTPWPEVSFGAPDTAADNPRQPDMPAETVKEPLQDQSLQNSPIPEEPHNKSLLWPVPEGDGPQAPAGAEPLPPQPYGMPPQNAAYAPPPVPNAYAAPQQGYPYAAPPAAGYPPAAPNAGYGYNPYGYAPPPYPGAYPAPAPYGYSAQGPYGVPYLQQYAGGYAAPAYPQLPYGQPAYPYPAYGQPMYPVYPPYVAPDDHPGYYYDGPKKGFGKTCILNPGMLIFIILTGGMTLWNFLGWIVLAAL